jgi:pimeloyl-ACP methyl ester carboxylesterase
VRAIGLLGHSEGGLIAPLAADGNADVAFMVLLAGPAVDGNTVIISQSRAIAAADGNPPAAVDAIEAQQRAVYACFGAIEQPLAELDACLVEVLADQGIGEADSAPLRAQVETPGWRYFVAYDPAPVLRRTRVPALALNGSLDVQVVASVNIPAFEAAFAEARNARASVLELEGLNHMFQHATTGSFREYAQIEETMAPEVLTQISEWIRSARALHQPEARLLGSRRGAHSSLVRSRTWYVVRTT